MSTAHIRPANESDAPAVSRICLLTADAGKSAESLHDHGELPGLVYAVPYVKLPTTFGFVMVDRESDEHEQVVGYVLGSKDTRSFEVYAAEHWWPDLAKRYASLPLTKPADVRYAKLLGDMHTASDASIRFAAAHLHIDILEKYQRQGWGRKLIGAAVEFLRGQNVQGEGVWLGLDPRNEGARQFYHRLGFQNIEGADENQLGLKFADWK